MDNDIKALREQALDIRARLDRAGSDLGRLTNQLREKLAGRHRAQAPDLYGLWDDCASASFELSDALGYLPDDD